MSADRWVRIEVGLLAPPQKTKNQVSSLARAIKSLVSGVTVETGLAYSKAIKAIPEGALEWRLVDSAGNGGARTSYRLLSPRISTNESGSVARVAEVLEAIASRGKQHRLEMNQVTGLRLHVSAHGLSSAALVRLCQNFVKYEEALDSLVPPSRRTGSDASDKYFRSNKAAVARGNQSNKQKNDAIAACDNVENLIELVNPRGSCYKLNLRNATSRGGSSQDPQCSSTLEFRQHSVTSNIQKIQAWIGLCLALVENSARLPAPSPLKASRTLDEQWSALFQYVVRDEDLRVFYQGRRQQLSGATNKRKASSKTVSKPAKTDHKMKECECCFSKVSAKTTCSCQDNGHIFCHTCVERYAKEQLFSNQESTLSCLSMEGCSSDLNTRQVQKALPDVLCKKLRAARYFRDEESSGNFICECPKCGSKAFVPRDQTTFFCPKETCLHKSCRACNEPAHGSIPCSQVEKRYVTNARTAVEESMSTARIRKCPRCHLPFVRDYGCDYVTCSRCHATSCYRCGALAQGHHCPCTMPSRTEHDQVKQAGTRKVASLSNILKRGELDGLVDKLV